MEEKKYLKWYHKVGYGSGDLAANCIYSLITSFMMIYLTDSVGLAAGVVGTLMMFARFFDGVTDVFFGSLIDKTKSKMGKARPWMLYSEIGNCIFLVLLFSVPMGLGKTAQYIYFFITYVCLNAVFYTANNIAYASLTSLITRNGTERVQMGSIRFMFSLVTNVVISSVTVGMVGTFGGGAKGWRVVAIIYATIAFVVNAISVFSVKELPNEEMSTDVKGDRQAIIADEKVSFVESIKLLLANKYFVLIAVSYICIYIQTGITGIGVYYMTYVMGDASLLGLFTMAQMLPIVVGLAFTPLLVAKFKGMYKVNLYGYMGAVVFRIGFLVSGYMKNIPLMLICSALGGLCASPVMGSTNALISAASDYTVRTKGKHIEGAMFSCSSLGIKIGGGIGSALSGILLSLGGYVANAPEQPASAINMLNFMYLWFPFIIVVLMCIILSKLKVEQANAEWDKEHNKK